jgi:hypothetical protein
MEELQGHADIAGLRVVLLAKEDGEARDGLTRQALMARMRRVMAWRQKIAAERALDLIQTHNEMAAADLDRLAGQHIQGLREMYGQFMATGEPEVCYIRDDS